MNSVTRITVTNEDQKLPIKVQETNLAKTEALEISASKFTVPAMEESDLIKNDDDGLKPDEEEVSHTKLADQHEDKQIIETNEEEG